MPVIKKTISSKEVKKPDTKKPVKKAVLIKSKTKPLSKAVSAKKTLVKRITTKETAKVTKQKKAINTGSEGAVVFLPSTISLRLQEKVQLYSIWYKDNISSYAATTARYGGYAFVILGTLLTTFNYLVDKDYLATPAAVICAEDVCREIEDSALPVGSPLITFMSSLPETIESKLDFIVKVENTKDFTVTLVSTYSGEVFNIKPSETLSETAYRYFIIPSSLNDSSYTIYAESSVGETTYKFTGPSFSILENESQPQILAADELGFDLEISTSTTTSTSALTLNTTPTSDVTLVSTSTESDILAEVEENSTKPAISVSLKELKESKYLSIKTGNYLPKKVEVYTTLIGSDNKVFLGLASLIQGEWIFSLSAFDLPNTKQLIFASFSNDTETYTSEGIIYSPTHSKLINKELDVDLDISNLKIISALESAELTLEERSNYFSTTTLASVVMQNAGSEAQFGSETLREQITAVMLKNEEKTNIILQGYASAVQVGQTYLINHADSVVRQHYEDMAREVVEKISQETFLPSINTILALRFFSIKNLIVDNETQFNSITNQQFSKDTDGDGISDYDELSLYISDPTMADSDMDGVTDGVEIVSLKNPSLTDLSSFAFINQNIEGTNPDEVTSITSIEPLVYKQISDVKEHVYAVVRGKSVPNSFVYIFNNIASSVGVIKTSENGDFLYTLEKNLSDGPQEFIAIKVDNHGRVVSNSTKYSFVKSTNSFAAAAVVSNQPLFDFTPGRDSILTTNAMASITVVALGFLLLLLSQAVQTRRKFLVDTKDAKTV